MCGWVGGCGCGGGGAARGREGWGLEVRRGASL